MFIFQVNLGMWPLKLIVSEKHEPCSEGFNTHLWISKEIDGKTFICSSKPRHVTPQIDCLRKMSPVLRVSTHIYGVFKEIHWKTFIFRVNLGMWPLKLIVAEKWAMVWGFQHTFMAFLMKYMSKHSFSSKPRHVIPQIDCLRKMSPVLSISTHIYRVSNEIDGKTFIFQVNLGMWPLNIDCLRKTNPVLRVSTHIYRVSKEIDGKMFIFKVNLGIWPLKLIFSEKWALFWGFQHTFMAFLMKCMSKHSFSSKPRHASPNIDCLRKTSPVLRVSTHIYGVFKEIDGKTFIFRVNLGMWALKLIVSGKTSPVLRVSTHIYGISKEIHEENIHFFK